MPISRAEVDSAKYAAKAMSNLATGWGAASDAKTIATFLETATTNPPLFHAFCDEFGRKEIWHPAQLKEFIESKLGQEEGTKAWVGAGSPLGVRLQALTATAQKELDPEKVGNELNNFATGWYDNGVLMCCCNNCLPS